MPRTPDQPEDLPRLKRHAGAVVGVRQVTGGKADDAHREVIVHQLPFPVVEAQGSPSDRCDHQFKKNKRGSKANARIAAP